MRRLWERGGGWLCIGKGIWSKIIICVMQLAKTQQQYDELEVSMAFPTCWDGVSIDREDHMPHVAYDIEGGRFDGECPNTHLHPPAQKGALILNYVSAHSFGETATGLKISLTAVAMMNL